MAKISELQAATHYNLDPDSYILINEPDQNSTTGYTTKKVSIAELNAELQENYNYVIVESDTMKINGQDFAIPSNFVQYNEDTKVFSVLDASGGEQDISTLTIDGSYLYYYNDVQEEHIPISNLCYIDDNGQLLKLDTSDNNTISTAIPNILYVGSNSDLEYVDADGYDQTIEIPSTPSSGLSFAYVESSPSVGYQPLLYYGNGIGPIPLVYHCNGRLVDSDNYAFYLATASTGILKDYYENTIPVAYYDSQNQEFYYTYSGTSHTILDINEDIPTPLANAVFYAANESDGYSTLNYIDSNETQHEILNTDNFKYFDTTKTVIFNTETNKPVLLGEIHDSDSYRTEAPVPLVYFDSAYITLNFYDGIQNDEVSLPLEDLVFHNDTNGFYKIQRNQDDPYNFIEVPITINN